MIIITKDKLQEDEDFISMGDLITDLIQCHNKKISISIKKEILISRGRFLGYNNKILLFSSGVLAIGFHEDGVRAKIIKRIFDDYVSYSFSTTLHQNVGIKVEDQ